MYITHELKNQTDRRRSEKRVSNMLNEMKISHQLKTEAEEGVWLFDKGMEKCQSDRVSQLEKKKENLPQIKNKMSRFAYNNSSDPDNIGQEKQKTEKKLTLQKTDKKKKTKKNKHQKKMSTPIELPSLPPQSIRFTQEQISPYDLRFQNYKKLQNFIKGGYNNEQDEYSSYVNLQEVDRTRNNFITFNKLYSKVIETNIEEKLTIRDVKKGGFLRDVVLVNEHKKKMSEDHLKNVLDKMYVPD